jgi:YD repeat-containing protein
LGRVVSERRRRKCQGDVNARAEDDLTGLTYSSSGTTLGDLAYAYDANGQRTQIGGSWARTSLPAAITGNTYNADNQLTSWNGATLSYDLDGNLTSDGTTTYSWDARNQLSSLTGPSNASFSYDGFGRRTSTTISGSTTGYLYDGANIVQELSGGSPSANMLTGLGVDEVFSRTY